MLREDIFHKNTIKWFETLYRGEINDHILIIHYDSNYYSINELRFNIKDEYNLTIKINSKVNDTLEENENTIIIHDFINNENYLTPDRTYIYIKFDVSRLQVLLENENSFYKEIEEDYIISNTNNIIKLHDPSEIDTETINLVYSQGNIQLINDLLNYTNFDRTGYYKNKNFIDSLKSIDLQLYKEKNLIPARFLNFLYRLYTLDFTISSTRIGIFYRNLLSVKSQLYKPNCWYKRGSLLIDKNKYLTNIKVYDLNKRDSLVHIKKSMAKEILKLNIKNLTYEKLSEILELSPNIIKNIDKKTLTR